MRIEKIGQVVRHFAWGVGKVRLFDTDTRRADVEFSDGKIRTGLSWNHLAGERRAREPMKLETIPEGFLPIPGYEGYYAHRDGRLISTIRWIVLLSPHEDEDGYQFVSLGVTKNFPVHHAVLITFSGPRPDGLQCRHLNGNPRDNSIGNLAWGTSKQNNEDRIRHGRTNRRLTPEQVEAIRTYKVSLNAAVQLFGIGYNRVSAIRAGRTYAEVSI